MNNNRLTASKSKAALEEQSYDLIQQHIIDPENSPLPEHLRVQCNRVLQIARLLDDYPNESHIINIMLRIKTSRANSPALMICKAFLLRDMGAAILVGGVNW